MSEERANKIYDVLVNLGGAPESMRFAFIYHYTKSDERTSTFDTIPSEWRFQGKLGYGGKYWTERNAVNCYSEDETPEILKLIKDINNELSKL